MELSTTTLILIAVLVACCLMPMLFMKGKSKDGEKPGDKPDMK